MNYENSSQEFQCFQQPSNFQLVSNLHASKRNSAIIVRDLSINQIQNSISVRGQHQNTINQSGKPRKTPKFIKILYDILRLQQYNQMICWTPDQEAFIINKEKIMDFSNQVLAKYFKHSNYGSFVRQLNMYNFVKIRLRIISETQEYDSQNDIFKHNSFRKGNLLELSNIKRKNVNKSNSKKRSNQIAANFEQNQLAIIQKKPLVHQSVNQRQLVQFGMQEEIVFSREQSDIFPQNLTISAPMQICAQQKIKSLMKEQQNLQQKCLQVLRQNQMISSQISNLYRRIHMQALNKNKIIEELIKYLNLLEDKDLEQPCQLVLSKNKSNEDYKHSRTAFQFSLQKFLNLIKNNQANDICLQMFQQFFDKRQIQIFMQKFSFLLQSQLRYTNPSINKPKVIPLSYQQPHKRSPKFTFQQILQQAPSLLNLGDNIQEFQEKLQ